MIPVGHYAALLNAIRARVAELGISYELVDEFAGLTSGHFSKLVCDPPIKRMGSLTLFLVLEALGLQLRLSEDPEARARTEARFKKREKPHHMQRGMQARLSMGLMRDFFVLCGRKGGRARAQKLSYKQARKIAQKAARARWGRQ